MPTIPNEAGLEGKFLQWFRDWVQAQGFDPDALNFYDAIQLVQKHADVAAAQTTTAQNTANAAQATATNAQTTAQAAQTAAQAATTSAANAVAALAGVKALGLGTATVPATLLGGTRIVAVTWTPAMPNNSYRLIWSQRSGSGAALVASIVEDATKLPGSCNIQVGFPLLAGGAVLDCLAVSA